MLQASIQPIAATRQSTHSRSSHAAVALPQTQTLGHAARGAPCAPLPAQQWPPLAEAAPAVGWSLSELGPDFQSCCAAVGGLQHSGGRRVRAAAHLHSRHSTLAAEQGREQTCALGGLLSGCAAGGDLPHSEGHGLTSVYGQIKQEAVPHPNTSQPNQNLSVPDLAMEITACTAEACKAAEQTCPA